MNEGPGREPVRFEIRKATKRDIPDIARVHVDSWRTTYAGIIPQKYLDGLTYAQRETQWDLILSKRGSRTVILVAVDRHGTVVGFMNAGPARESVPDLQGEIYAVYILKEYQGSGIGRELFTATAKWLYKRGMKSLYVWVLTQNPARRFYEKMEGENIATRNITIGEKLLGETAYGWRDLARLLHL